MSSSSFSGTLLYPETGIKYSLGRSDQMQEQWRGQNRVAVGEEEKAIQREMDEQKEHFQLHTIMSCMTITIGWRSREQQDENRLTSSNFSNTVGQIEFLKFYSRRMRSHASSSLLSGPTNTPHFGNSGNLFSTSHVMRDSRVERVDIKTRLSVPQSSSSCSSS